MASRKWKRNFHRVMTELKSLHLNSAFRQCHVAVKYEFSFLRIVKNGTVAALCVEWQWLIKMCIKNGWNMSTKNELYKQDDNWVSYFEFTVISLVFYILSHWYNGDLEPLQIEKKEDISLKFFWKMKETHYNRNKTDIQLRRCAIVKNVKLLKTRYFHLF